MRVCHVSSVHGADDIRIFKKQCMSLANSGVDVTFLVTADKDENRCGVNIKGLKRRSVLLRLILTLPEVLFFCFRNKFDIYHAHDPELIPILFILHIFGKRVVYDMHENFPKQLKTKAVHPFIRLSLSLVWPFIERVVLSRINVIFAETSYKDSYKYISSCIDVLNMPLLGELRVIDQTKHDEFSIGYVGGVSKERYLDDTLKAIEILEKKGLSIRFDCIGPVYHEESISFIEDYKKKLSNFNFYGELPPNEAWGIIAKCHVGIAMLYPLPNYVGSYPTKLFEYLGMKMPVITSNFELYKPIVENNNVGFCVDPLDINEFVGALEKLATDPDLYDLMSKNTEVILENKFSWNIEFKKLDDFYRLIK